MSKEKSKERIQKQKDKFQEKQYQAPGPQKRRYCAQAARETSPTSNALCVLCLIIFFMLIPVTIWGENNLVGFLLNLRHKIFIYIFPLYCFFKFFCRYGR